MHNVSLHVTSVRSSSGPAASTGVTVVPIGDRCMHPTSNSWGISLLARYSLASPVFMASGPGREAAPVLPVATVDAASLTDRRSAAHSIFLVGGLSESPGANAPSLAPGSLLISCWHASRQTAPLFIFMQLLFKDPKRPPPQSGGLDEGTVRSASRRLKLHTITDTELNGINFTRA